MSKVKKLELDTNNNKNTKCLNNIINKFNLLSNEDLKDNIKLDEDIEKTII